MTNRDTEMLFPTRVIPELSDLRGLLWQRLVSQTLLLDPGDPDRIAFTLMMTKVCNCVTCQADSFRAMKGCSQCAWQAIQRFKGEDQELKEIFLNAQDEITTYRNCSER